MKKEIFQEIEIPEGVEVNLEKTTIFVKGPEGEIERKFKTTRVSFEKKDNKIVVGNKKATKKEKKLINTIAAHIKNMVEGVQNKFEYTLKVCSTHFPISVEIKDNEFIIKNFLGEKIPRKSKIIEGSEAIMDGNTITIKSHNKEIAGQTAANLETATKVKKKDLRVFQDGIFMITKPGREI